MDDSISRQAAIDRIRGTGYADQIKENVIVILMGLPSAQPEKMQLSREDATFDCISRQAVIDAIEDDNRNGHYSCFASNSDAQKFKQVVNELPSAQPEQRWIPCSERLPDEKDVGILKKIGTSKRSEYVLATVEVKGERMTVTACTYDGEWDWKMKYAFPDYKIIAWMPLPEPYKGEQE